MIDKYRDKHLNRIIETCTNLYNQKESICRRCHDSDKIICIFCYCPLYDLDSCGGNPIILPNGIKDCSNCMKPHTEEFVRWYLK